MKYQKSKNVRLDVINRLKNAWQDEEKIFYISLLEYITYLEVKVGIDIFNNEEPENETDRTTE